MRMQPSRSGRRNRIEVETSLKQNPQSERPSFLIGFTPPPDETIGNPKLHSLAKRRSLVRVRA
jgi:hypothetical protein